MKLIVTGGGTGGHVYPALSVVDALVAAIQRASESVDVVWVGTANSIEERIVAASPWEFRAISTGALRGANPLEAIGNVSRIARGCLQGLRLIADLRPSVVLATGGYVSVPLVVAARLRRVPVLIYLPDMEPGMAVTWLSKISQRVAVSFDSVASYFSPEKVVVTGYPVRRALYEYTEEDAASALGLDPAQPILLVLGGSRGAHSINSAISAGLGSILNTMQLVHISGPNDYDDLAVIREGLPNELQVKYHLHAYLYDLMPQALRAADLVVARSGAATLGEFPAVGLPAILVPYPYAGEHQERNARFLADRGAARIIRDANLDEELIPMINELMGDAVTLGEMGARASALAVPDAADHVARELVRLSLKRATG